MTHNTIDEILYKIGSDINEVYTSEALTPWCTHHYFKLIKGRCVGCEAKTALLTAIMAEMPDKQKRTDNLHGPEGKYGVEANEVLYLMGYNQALEDVTTMLKKMFKE